ncbi:MAG: 5'-deoxynucleotidase [Gammaproteobacteria bacterium]|nr:5'-deoxynucleotidase [Gammaproteobacteria bacterium]
MNINFTAWWFRAKNILRWPLQHTLVSNNVANHSFECTIVAHMIAVIDKEIFNHQNTDPNYVGMLAAFHEGAEVAGCGDINSVAKNYDEETRLAIKRLESLFEEKLLNALPKHLRATYHPLIVQDKTNRAVRLAKCADDFCAYLEASKEMRLGNLEFATAMKGIHDSKILLWCEEFEAAQYFYDHCLAGFNDDFDQLHNESN